MDATPDPILDDETDETIVGVTGHIIGFIDAINESGIYGWAYDISTPNTATTIKFYIDGVWIEDVVCKAFRPDVAGAGHPATEVGFRVGLPTRFCDGERHSYSFRDENDDEVMLGGIGSGEDEERSFRYDFCFDVDFYATYYLGIASRGGIAEFEDWKANGAARGHLPNAEALLDKLREQGRKLPRDFSPQYYRFLNRDIAHLIGYDWQAKLHYLETGEREARPYKIELTDFIIDLYFDGKRVSPAEIARKASQPSSYQNLLDMMLRNGVTSDAFLKLFSVEDYVACVMPVMFHNKLQCIRHFLEIGRKAMRPISFQFQFDPDFYREAAGLTDLAKPLTDQDAYLHWINEGIDRNIAPSGAAFLRQIGLNRMHRFPEGFDPAIYCAHNPDLDRQALPTRWDILREALNKGIAEGKAGCTLDETTSEMFRVAADQLSISRSFQSARGLYEKVLGGFPEDTMAMRHYADCLLRLGEFFQASLFYQRAIQLGRDNVWTHLNLTSCFLHMKRWSDAAAAISRLADLRPGDSGVQRRYQDVVREGFDALSNEATWLARNKFYDRARATMEQACAILTRRLHAEAPAPIPQIGSIRSVAIIGDLGLPQCRLYRVTQKCEQLKLAGIDVTVFDYITETTGYIERAGEFDAVIFYRVPAIPVIVRAIETARKAGQPSFYEIDDLMFDHTVFPADFDSYGGQISHDIYAGLVTGAVTLRHALASCDFAIASTPSLAAAMERLTRRGKAFVHRNALGSAHARGMASGGTMAGEEIRLFYGTGTKAHNSDFERELAPSLAKLFEKHGDAIRLVILGYLTLPAMLEPYADRITQIESVWDIDLYWTILRDMHINIAVLEPGPVADCKSEIKWLEAAMLGIPSVVSATATYQEVIRDGETGVLVHAPDQWFSALDKLISSDSKRRAIGARARDAVQKNYALPQLSANIASLLNSVVSNDTSSPALRRLRVLVVHVFFPPQSFGGATRVVADNISDIASEFGDEFEIEVFTTLEGSPDPYRVSTYRWEGVRVTAITTPSEADINLKVTDNDMGKAFAATLERFAPDLIHFHCIQRLTTSLCTVASDKGIPYLVTAHDAWWLSDEQFIIDAFGNSTFYRFDNPLAELSAGGDASFRRMMVKQKCLNGAARVLSVSEPFTRIYRSFGFKNVITLENGSPPFTKPQRTVSRDRRVRLAHIGGTSFHKGYNLIQAVLSAGHFSNLHHLQIDHAMDAGTERSGLWGATEVLFRATVPQREVGRLYAEIDVLLAPSLWPESYGLVVREALSAGCWVVTSDRGAIGQDVPQEAGFVVDVGSHDGLRAVLARMNDDAATFTQSPSVTLNLRTARQQAIELAAEYRRFATFKSDSAPALKVVSSGNRPARKTAPATRIKA
jgi:glycosyltransferase involved in cell wall biosynthesis/tetratricopeptide (TPR) repeat protein